MVNIRAIVNTRLSSVKGRFVLYHICIAVISLQINTIVNKAFLRYCLFSLGFPLAWVSAFSLLDYYGILLLNYGSVEGHCWLGNVKGMYVSFFAPIFTLLCLNFVLLLATVNVIRKCSQVSQKLAEGVKAPVNKSDIWIYIRMATLMGFTWLLGVFQLSFPSVVVFDYLFVFVNGLQGFYIALAFLFTDNIKKVLSKSITCIKCYKQNRKHF